VVSYNEELGKLILGATQGQFYVNNTIHAVSTNGVCQIQSFDASPLLLSSITVRPDPINAEPTDDYGYDIDIVEFGDE
jgi:hypothetical protein